MIILKNKISRFSTDVMLRVYSLKMIWNLAFLCHTVLGELQILVSLGFELMLHHNSQVHKKLPEKQIILLTSTRSSTIFSINFSIDSILRKKKRGGYIIKDFASLSTFFGLKLVLHLFIEKQKVNPLLIWYKINIF